MQSSSEVTILTETAFGEALVRLSDRDEHLRVALLKWGSPPFWTHPPGFPGLVLAILAQQVSVESAQAAFSKLESAVGTVEPSVILALDDQDLRSVGFSRQKASYVRGLAKDISEARLDLAGLETIGNTAARDELMRMRGIGKWTADTYLLFSLRRSDVWPSGDLALAKSIQEVMRMRRVPSYEDVDRLATRWSPWRAVAARVLWHSYLSRRGR